MGNGLYRKEALNRISSPEQLNDYIKVTNPSVWVILGAIVLLLVSVCVWGIFGRLETSMVTSGTVYYGQVAMFVDEEEAAQIKVGQKIWGIGDMEGSIISVSEEPYSYEVICTALADDEFAVYSMKLQEGDFRYLVTARIDGVEDGVQPIKIITDSISPMSFVFD